MWVDDLGTVLVNAGVGTLGTNIFAGTAATIPTGAGPYLSIIETPGLAPELVQNADSYRHPSVQILVRAKSPSAANTMARAAYNALRVIQNQTIGSTWYLSIRPRQEPFDLGVDDNGRARVAFNVLGHNRP